MILRAFIVLLASSHSSTVLADVFCDFSHGSCCPKWPDSVTIADSVTVIPEKAFYGCKTLTSVIVGKNVTDLGKQTFEKSTLTSISVPDGVTNMGWGAFSECTGLTEINIPYGATRMYDNLFYGCTSLTSIVIPDTVTDVGWGVFFGCESLTSVVIGKGVTSLSLRMFYGCIRLNSALIPSSVNTLGDAVFLGCTSLTTLVIPDSVVNIGIEVFFGCSSLAFVTIGSGLKRLPGRMFVQCTSLTSIVIPNSVIEIDAAVFMGCSALTSVVIENSAVVTVNALGYAVFQGCSSLTSVTVQNSMAGAISPSTSLYLIGSEPSAAFYGTPMASIPFDFCPSHPYNALVTYTAAGSVTPACLAPTAADIISIPTGLGSPSLPAVGASVAILVATIVALLTASFQRSSEATAAGLSSLRLSTPSLRRLWTNLRWLLALISPLPVGIEGDESEGVDFGAVVWDASDMSEEFSLLTADQSPLHAGEHQPRDQFSVVQVKLLSQIHKLEEDGGRRGMTLEGLYTYDPPRASIDDKRSELGHGTFGVTYRKKNVIDGQLYAVKVLRCIDSTTNEARFLQVLSHPNIVKYFASFKTHQGSELNIVMELVDGCALSSYIHCAEPPSKELITKWLVQTLKALRYLHDNMRILHRDIKPDNILISSAGQDIKLIDLGLATVLKATLQSSRTGSSQYASYEKLHFMKYDGRDDIWAVGCVWSELITRKPIVGNAPLCLPSSAKILQQRVAQGVAYDSRLGGVVAAMLTSSQADIPTASQCLDLMQWAGAS